MSSLIVDEGNIRCLVTGKMRKETPEEYIRQEYCRILLDVYNYPKGNIDLEYPIKQGSSTTRADIVVFNDSRKSQDNIYLIIETKKKQETEGIEQLFSYMTSTTAIFGVWTNGESIKYYYRDLSKIDKFHELPDIPKYKESVDSIGKYKKDDLVKCTDLKGAFL
jgi:type I restriction enzyme M protein